MTFVEFGEKYGYHPDTIRNFVKQNPKYGYKVFDVITNKEIIKVNEKAIIKDHERVYNLWLYNTNFLYFELKKCYKRDSKIAKRLTLYNYIKGEEEVTFTTWTTFLADGLFRTISDSVLNVKPNRLQILFFKRGRKMLKICKRKGENNGKKRISKDNG